MHARKIAGGASLDRSTPSKPVPRGGSLASSTRTASLGGVPRSGFSNAAATSGRGSTESGAEAASAAAAPAPPPTYFRLVVDGVEDDGGDYAKCAELIASVLERRLAYKGLDKGQHEQPVTVEEVSALAMTGPSAVGAARIGAEGARRGMPLARIAPDKEENVDKDRPANIPASATSMSAAATQKPSTPSMALTFEDGIFRVGGTQTELVPWPQYIADIQKLYQAIESGPCLSTARSRLTSLAHKFQLYALMNAEVEANHGGVNSGYGGGHVRSTKVDNALHMKTSVPAPTLLEFLQRTAREQPHMALMEIPEATATLVAAGFMTPEEAERKAKKLGKAGGTQSTHSLSAGANQSSSRDGRHASRADSVLGGRGSLAAAAARNCMTLRQFLQAAGVTDPALLTAEGLGLHPTLYRNKFLPYDMFNSQLNPAGPLGAKLLQAVLSTDNDGANRGDLCGSLIRSELEKREFKPRQAVVTEMLLDVGGVSEHEVCSLAAWTRRQGFNNFTTNMWVLNIVPRFKKGFDGEGCAAAAMASSTGMHMPVPAGAGQSVAHAMPEHPWMGTSASKSIASAYNPGFSLAPPATNTMMPTCRTVGQQLRNIFYPLFMATLYPTDPRWSDVAQLLMNTSAMSIQTEASSRTQNLFTNPVHPDSIRISLSQHKKANDSGPLPGGGATSAASATVSTTKEVSDFYFFYYVWANLASLNALRTRFGLNTLNFNPSIQEQAPAYDQLACSFLLGDNVYHANSLHKCWIMQYLYMYARVGLVLSPLRDNVVSVSYLDHPVVKYFQQGLQVSLSTSSPLHFHHRVDQPLLEEYASLLKLRSLSPTDLCEMARNSVLNSNYPDRMKRKWLGEKYTLIGCSGNDVARSNVCDARLQFRYECLAQEEAVLNRVLAKLADNKSKPGAPPASPRIVSIIAEAASPLRMVGGTAASLGQGLVLGTAATAAAVAARRLRSIAKADALAGTSVAAGGASSLPRQRRASHANPSTLQGSKEMEYVDRRVAFPRVKISFGNGLGRGADGGAFDVDEDEDEEGRGGTRVVGAAGTIALGNGGLPAPVAVYGAKGKKSGYITVASLRQVLLLRRKYLKVHAADVNVEDVFNPANQLDEDKWEYNSYYGVVLLSRVGKSAAWPTSIPPLREFIRDVETVRQAASSTTLRRLAAHRLRLLEKKFQLHLAMNISNEGGTRQEKEWNNRDFFTAHKVDTNVQMESGHNAHTLLEFTVDKAVNHGDDVVGENADLNPITLRTLLQHYEVRVETLTVDELHHLLDTHEDLRRTFLSPHNYMQGRYFAELSKRTLSLYQEDAYSFAENRLPLQGNSREEWRQLSHWFDRYGMASSQSRWMVNIPREYAKLRTNGEVADFGEFLDNIFLPLWEISLHPARDTRLHYFLTHVSGFDCTASEESTVDAPMVAVHPHDWRDATNPPYNYYMYYLWANITSLNEFRASRGLSTFSFRPQCGELGGLEHLIGGCLLANGINHGVTLAKHPVLEYVFYLAQIGIAMSPLSNTAAASAYLENPFPVYFQRGLNVSLATNTPLYFHFTREPLIEEYSIAAKLWQLEFNDLSEIARNSVLQCGFPPAWKATALGQLYHLHSTLGNDVRRSRLSDIRVAFRYECYHSELNFLDAQLVQPSSATAAVAGTGANRLTGQRSLIAGSEASAASTTHGARGQQLMPRVMRPLSEEMAMYRSTLGHGVSSAGAAGKEEPTRQSGGEVDGGTGIPTAGRLARLLSRSACDGLEAKEEGGSASGSVGSLSDEDDDADEGGFAAYMGDGCGCHSQRHGGNRSEDAQGDTADASARTARDERRRQRRLVRQQQRELDRLEEELRQLESISRHLHVENGAVAEMITQMRARLASEGLAILGGLVTAPRSANTEGSQDPE